MNTFEMSELRPNGRSVTMLDNAAAIELREWLNSNCKHYECFKITDNQLAAWLSDADCNEGLIEISARWSVTGVPMTFWVAA